MSFTYLTTRELSARFKYDERTIRERLIDSVLIEGRHYFRPFGGRKILFIWESIEEDMRAGLPGEIPNSAAGEGNAKTSKSPSSGRNSAVAYLAIPMANGRTCHG